MVIVAATAIYWFAFRTLSVTVYAEKDIPLASAALDAEKVPYELKQGNKFVFPAKYSEVVWNALRSIRGNPIQHLQGRYVEKALASEFSSALLKRSIPFNMNHEGEEVLFSWQNRFDSDALEVLAEVEREHGV